MEFQEPLNMDMEILSELIEWMQKFQFVIGVMDHGHPNVFWDNGQEVTCKSENGFQHFS